MEEAVHLHLLRRWVLRTVALLVHFVYWSGRGFGGVAGLIDICR